MSVLKFKNITVLAFMSFALAACGDSGVDEETLKLLSEKLKLNKSEVAALRVCAETSDGSAPFVRFGSTILKMTPVPLEVCGCQTKVISAVLKEDKLASYAKFVKWVGDPERKGAPKFKKKELLYAAPAKTIGDRLAASLDSCSRQYADANVKQAKKLLKPYVAKAPKKKDAVAKTAEKKASAT